ncbi:MAG: hypothetical protein V4649_11565 [Bacteroidota bacterium]
MNLKFKPTDKITAIERRTRVLQTIAVILAFIATYFFFLKLVFL